MRLKPYAKIGVWECGEHTVEAYTKSEARSLVKREIGYLPNGTQVKLIARVEIDREDSND